QGPAASGPRGVGARWIGGSGTWDRALLDQGQQIEQGRSGEFGARRRGAAGRKVGGQDGEAKPHEVAVGHEDVARALRGMADRDGSEAAPVQGVGRVGYFDPFGPRGWVVEGGVMLLNRSTRLTTGS